METPNSSTSRKAATARANGRKGRGPKNCKFTRWNAVRHALTALRLGILEGKHLPEYGAYADLHAQLVRLLSPLNVLELAAINDFVIATWRQHRAFRFELSETEKPDNGMLSPGMHNLLRYSNSADHKFDKSYARIMEISERKKTSAAAQLAAAAARNFGGDQRTSSQPAAAAAVPQTAPVSVEPLDTTPTTGHSEDALGGEEPRQSALPTPSASSEPGDGAGDTPHEAVPSAAAAEAAQPAQSPAGVSSTTAIEEEQKSDSPGEG